MKVKLSAGFVQKVDQQIEFIAKDKPLAAQQFKARILERIKKVSVFPYSSRKSIYFNNEQIRECIIKGYKIVYRIKPEKEEIEIFGLIKFQKEP